MKSAIPVRTATWEHAGGRYAAFPARKNIGKNKGSLNITINVLKVKIKML